MQCNDTDIKTNNTDSHLVVLNRTVEVTDINALFRRLEQALCVTASTLMLDAEGVERIDAASLQLLTVFYREAEELGYAVQWKKPSDALQQSARLVGLAHRLGLKSVSTAQE